jgi:hypothetical protein
MEHDFPSLDDADEASQPCPECGEELNEFPGGGHYPDCTYVRDNDPDLHVIHVREPQHEGVCFDKFMDRTLLAEHRLQTVDAKAPSPQRRIARGYQEHPLGKVRMGVRRG